MKGRFTNGMIKTLSNLLQQDKEKYRVPRRVQDVIPIRRIWPDGIFLVGNKYSKMYCFSDINYLVASRADKESMFLMYSELLNSLDAGATAKITINNRRLNRVNFEKNILMPLRGDARDIYRREYNQMLLDKAMEGNGIIQEKYITVTVLKRMWKKHAPTLPARAQISAPTLPPSAPSVRSWTLPSACASCMTSTVSVKRWTFTLTRRT